MKKVYLFFITVVFAISANAQMKVFNTGKLLLGGTSGTVTGNMQFNIAAGASNGLTFYNSTYNQNALRLTVDDYSVFLRDGIKNDYGLGFYDGSVYAGYYNAFGDCGGALNVRQNGTYYYYGLYASYDNTTTDGTAVYANVARNTSLAFACNNNKFTVTGNGVVYAYGGYTPSDETLKGDVKAIESPIDKIMNLRGVSFKYKNSLDNNITKNDISTSEGNNTTSNKKGTSQPLDQAVMTIMEKENAELGHIGFIAQEVDKILPDVVRTSPNGTKAVAYSEIVALLVEGMKEQQTIIKNLETKLADLESALVAATVQKTQSITANTEKVSENNLLEAKLFQNTPNPFTQDTEVAFSLPETVQKADLYIYDMNGAQITQIALAQRGNAAVTINGGKLAAGMYLYSLIADGKIIDTKRMILTK